jgi:hypothetical protein
MENMDAILIYLMLEPESWIEDSSYVTLYFTRFNKENYRRSVKRINLFTVAHAGCKNKIPHEPIHKVKIYREVSSTGAL